MTLHREQLERETKFARIAKKAQSNPDEIFTSLSHHLTEEFLISSFRKLRKSAASGISTTEDKIVQRAETDILNNIYEQDFYDFSFGFRKKRSAHQALKQVHSGCMGRRIRFVLDADIQGCFDNFDHQILRDLLAKRVKDKWILRLINQWLKVGIVDGKTKHLNHKGSPQGNIMTPHTLKVTFNLNVL